jgi:hypothetical protein
MPQCGTQVLLPLDEALLPPPDVVLLPLDEALLPPPDVVLALPPPDVELPVVGLPVVEPAPLPPEPELVTAPLAHAARRAGRDRTRVKKIVPGCFTVLGRGYAQSGVIYNNLHRLLRDDLPR